MSNEAYCRLCLEVRRTHAEHSDRCNITHELYSNSRVSRPYTARSQCSKLCILGLGGSNGREGDEDTLDLDIVPYAILALLASCAALFEPYHEQMISVKHEFMIE